MKNWGLGRKGVMVVLAGLVWSCATDCEDEIAAAQTFLSAKANLACDSDSDCVVVTTGCHTFEGGFCSQSHLSRAAANGAEWASIKRDLDDCESDCAVCDAALAPAKCVDNRCGSPPE